VINLNHLVVQEQPRAKKQKKQGRRSQLTSGRNEQQNMEAGELENEDGLASGENDTKVTDASLYWPRNWESTSSAKTTDLNSLFPFEKESR